MLARGVCTCCSSFYALLLIGLGIVAYWCMHLLLIIVCTVALIIICIVECAHCTCCLSLYALLHCLSYALLYVHIVPVAYHCMRCCFAYHIHVHRCMYTLSLLLIILSHPFSTPGHFSSHVFHPSHINHCATSLE